MKLFKINEDSGGREVKSGVPAEDKSTPKLRSLHSDQRQISEKRKKLPLTSGSLFQRESKVVYFREKEEYVAEIDEEEEITIQRVLDAAKEDFLAGVENGDFDDLFEEEMTLQCDVAELTKPPPAKAQTLSPVFSGEEDDEEEDTVKIDPDETLNALPA